jgi:hypothetical protein
VTEAELTELFRRALRASAAAPLIASVAACSSSSTTPPTRDAAPGEDAAHDAAPHEHHDAGPPDCGFNPQACPIEIPVACIDGGVALDADLSPAECSKLCGAGTLMCSVGPEVDGTPLLECISASCGNGRAYEGMARPKAPGQRSPVGRYLAETAQLEAASVDAFRILGDELRALGAPPELTRATAVAAADEVRHARVTRRLARRHGPCPPHVRAEARPVRTLEAVAEENAVEGCVRETYAALLAHHQALVADDPEVRAAMATIAVDETRHAALAWSVARWAEGKLSSDARTRVRGARARAALELARDVRARVPDELAKVAGLPAAESAARMVAILDDALWASEGRHAPSMRA